MPSFRLSALTRARTFVFLALASALWLMIASPLRAEAATTTFVGDPSIEASVDNDSPGQAEAFGFTATASGTGTSASVYLDGSNSASTVKVGVYSNSRGYPSSLLASATISSAHAGAWNAVSLPSVSISAGRTY